MGFSPLMEVPPTAIPFSPAGRTPVRTTPEQPTPMDSTHIAVSAHTGSIPIPVAPKELSNLRLEGGSIWHAAVPLALGAVSSVVWPVLPAWRACATSFLHPSPVWPIGLRSVDQSTIVPRFDRILASFCTHLLPNTFHQSWGKQAAVWRPSAGSGGCT